MTKKAWQSILGLLTLVAIIMFTFDNYTLVIFSISAISLAVMSIVIAIICYIAGIKQVSWQSHLIEIPVLILWIVFIAVFILPLAEKLINLLAIARLSVILEIAYTYVAACSYY